MIRYNFMTNLENPEQNAFNAAVVDPLSLDLSKFPWKEGYQEFYVQETHIYKPYKISLEAYGTDNYDDVILLLNGISDPFDMKPGFKLYIPNKGEVDAYLTQNRNNNV